ncbi:MAG: hypothetical protein IT355_10730 [Gemmatimonadaceae bacterium]|nr:hypothetical protein [Gemmatimonadaceae bacterium]
MRLSTRLPVSGATTRPADRRGMAIIITLILTVALGALALSAVYLASGTKLATGLSNRAADLQYAADAALQMGKSYINADPDAMPESGYREITFNGGVLKDASGNVIPGVQVRVWAGPTGATTGQFGAFGSVIAQATDQTGAKVVRRLELAQENFARFAYWSNRENRGSGPIWFGSGDVLFGPTWSNDTIRITSKAALPWAAQFRDVVGTAKMIIQPDQADFWKGYTEHSIPIPMPTPAALSNMATYAASGRLNFVAPSNGDETTVRMRIEFVNIDLDNDGSSTDPQDGFIRVYTTNSGSSQSIAWIRGDQELFSTDLVTRKGLCGEWINVPGFGDRFFTANAHEQTAVRTWLLGRFQAALGAVAGTNMVNSLNFKTTPLNSAETRSILSRSGALLAGNRSQCFLGGAPELNFAELAPASYGGTSTNVGPNSTFDPADAYGTWRLYGGAVDPRLLLRAPNQAAYLFPLHRSVNPGARGVINVSGTVGLSGLLVGRVTLHTTGTAVVLDDLRYGTNPATTGRCVDVLGILSDKDVVVADNMLNNQTDADVTAATSFRLLDDSKDLTLHSVVMAMDMSFRVQNHDEGQVTGNPCNGTERGRGCLALLGGLIQEARGAVGTFTATNGTGFIKQYTYDRCANLRPPPYFPTTGRYLDNRYMEIDPVGFSIATLFDRLTPDD